MAYQKPNDPNAGNGAIAGKAHNDGYVPTSSASDDIENGLLRDLIYQAAQQNNADVSATAKSNYLNFLLTENQREFDTEWRDNEREYTSAASQLGRLMETGMSYSAAMAALSGSGDAGSASGLSAPAAAKADPSKDQQNALGIANTALTGISSLFGGIVSGCNLANSFKMTSAQVDLLSSQAVGQDIANNMSQRYLDGLGIADGVAGTIQSAISTGAWSPAESDYATSQSFIDAAYKSGVITDTQLNGIYSSQSAMDSFSEHFAHTWDTQGVKVSPALYDDAFKAFKANAYVQCLQPQMTEQELANSKQSFENMVAEYGNINADTKLKGAQAKLAKQQTRESSARTTGLQYENDVSKPRADAYRLYGSQVTEAGRLEIYMLLTRWSQYAKNEAQLKKQIDLDFQNGVVSREVAKQMISFEYQAYQALTDVTSHYTQSELASFALARDYAEYYRAHLRKIENENTNGANASLGVGTTGASAGLGLNTSGTTTTEEYQFNLR